MSADFHDAEVNEIGLAYLQFLNEQSCVKTF